MTSDTSDPRPDGTSTAGGAGERPVMLVLPGGGYVMHADHEAEPVADWLRGLGWEAEVLRYRISPDRYPAGLTDAAEAVLRLRADGATTVGVLGFSAGGHLAASLSHAVAHGFARAAVPDLAVLCYPVIALGELADGGSADALLGELPAATRDRALAIQQVHELVGPDTPPTFLWHTADDEAVPVQHALGYATALAAADVEFALHVFAHGRHGLGLVRGIEGAVPGVERWTDLCADWLAARLGRTASAGH
ncbi:acetyl esterase/lipase [Friedmanniella endophytica]|uniref:Acetyl esterase/lipase n=1 Tax=Microlunatus kandeliicorticis TaxID=1759536 RepID=A0A7W3IUA9_9ACTN|nr:alpha/beta hydrolase [Microlunatus kandeliicorticis]MBA8795265.1 acetyl esterase/lipase [Microlunatus kandeliicorticis]